MSSQTTDPARPAATEGDSPRGLVFAITTYVIWGFLPLYMKALAHVPVLEVLANRVIWSVPVAGAILIWLGRTADLMAALRNPRMLAMASLTAGLISLNWGIYVWAIGSGHTLDAALGYYINPLFSVALGAVLLRERLNGAQKAAVLLAALGVAYLAWQAGRLPIVAVGLTLTWGFYAFFKRKLPIGPNQGFMLEVLLLLPFALGYAVWLQATGKSHFLNGVPFDTWMLLAAGLVTAVPLMIYANGAKLLRLSTIGILQYIAPTMIFLTAVFVFDEPLDQTRMIAFPMIWAALVIYSVALLRGQKARPPR